ncbi:MAG: hypothetical protein ACYDCL_17460 [Myxococcales bacterium]
MPAQTHDQTRELLEALARMGSEGRAEGEGAQEFPKAWMPIREHLRAFDPDVVLVVGPRGAGKTELFKAVIEHGLLDAAAKHIQGLRLPPLSPTKTTWIAAYPIGTEFPAEDVLNRFISRTKPTGETFVEIWYAFLLRRLVQENVLPRTAALTPLLTPPAADLEGVLSAFQQAGPEVLGALDLLEGNLQGKGHQIVVAYDELDVIGGATFDTVELCVQGLVGFWARRSRRWRQIRAKIFLRTDLYDRAGALGGADFAKLAANRAELTWSDRNLYEMLVKRVANRDEKLLEYCQKKVTFESKEDSKLGWFPENESGDAAKALVGRMVGEYMGKNPNKGQTGTWILNHVRDGRGHAVPRPLVRLIEKGADLQLQALDFPKWPKLLKPMYLRRALDHVSDSHVNDSRSEWPWLDTLKKVLADEPEVPWERNRIERLLKGMKDSHFPAHGPTRSRGLLGRNRHLPPPPGPPTRQFDRSHRHTGPISPRACPTPSRWRGARLERPEA